MNPIVVLFFLLLLAIQWLSIVFFSPISLMLCTNALYFAAGPEIYYRDMFRKQTADVLAVN